MSRTEEGFCKIQYKESTGQTPDTFGMETGKTAAEASSDGCPTSHIFIPNLSSDGINALTIPISTEAFISHQCGSVLGLDASPVSLALVCKFAPILFEF